VPSAAAATTSPDRSGGTGSAGGAVDADAVRGRWAEILEAVKRERRVAWILLNNASVDGLQDGVLTLRFASEGQAKGFLGSGYDADLKGVLSAILGIAPQIRAISTAGDGGRGPGGMAGSGGGGPRTGGGGGSRASAAASAGSRPRQDAAADSRPRPGSTGGGAPHAVTASSGGPRAGGAADGAEWAEDDASDVGLAGMDLVQRELGGQIIGEISEP
jgi:DNA polymerase-3 subunit gamma/tau